MRLFPVNIFRQPEDYLWKQYNQDQTKYLNNHELHHPTVNVLEIPFRNHTFEKVC